MTDVMSRINQRLVELGGEGLYKIEQILDEPLQSLFLSHSPHQLIIGETKIRVIPNNLLIALEVIEQADWRPESDRYICKQIIFSQDYLTRALKKGFILDATGIKEECLNFFYCFSQELGLTPGKLFSQILEEFKRLHDSEPELAKLIAYNDFSQN